MNDEFFYAFFDELDSIQKEAALIPRLAAWLFRTGKTITRLTKPEGLKQIFRWVPKVERIRVKELEKAWSDLLKAAKKTKFTKLPQEELGRFQKVSREFQKEFPGRYIVPEKFPELEVGNPAKLERSIRMMKPQEIIGMTPGRLAWMGGFGTLGVLTKPKEQPLGEFIGGELASVPAWFSGIGLLPWMASSYITDPFGRKIGRTVQKVVAPKSIKPPKPKIPKME